MSLFSIFKKETPIGPLYPGQKAGVQEHLDYLITCRNYIAALTPPPNYKQIPHPYDATERIVGNDPRRPAILNGSYEYFNRTLLSITVPRFSCTAASVNKNGKWNMGFTIYNLGDSYVTLLKACGIYTLDESKIGYVRAIGTEYFEIDVPKENYKAGCQITEIFTQGNHTNAQELLSDITHQLEHVKIARDIIASGVKARAISVLDDGTTKMIVGRHYNRDQIISAPGMTCHRDNLGRARYSEDEHAITIPAHLLPEHLQLQQNLEPGSPRARRASSGIIKHIPQLGPRVANATHDIIFKE